MDLAAFIYVGPIVALIGLLFCFPNQLRAARLLGTFVAAVGVAVTAYGLIGHFDLPIMPAAVVPAAIVAAWCGGRVITHRSPVYSALYFGGVVLAAAVLVLVLTAHFLAAILIIVYAGAILVAYVFVIMLAQLVRPAEYDINVRQPALAVTVGAALVLAVVLAVLSSSLGVARRGYEAALPPAVATASPEGNVVSVGAVLFGDYPVTIEVAGVFLLIAMIGAIVLAGLRIPAEDSSS